MQATRENAKIGDPFKEENFAGAQISKVQHDRIMSYIEEGKKGGAKVLHGGARQGSSGYFIQPTVFADVSAFPPCTPSSLSSLSAETWLISHPVSLSRPPRT